MRYSLDQKASVVTTSDTCFVQHDSGSGNEFFWIRLRGLIIFSCYWRPGTSLAKYDTSLGDLNRTIQAMGDSRLIVAGDLNA